MIFKNLKKYGCEEIAFFYNEEADVKAIIAIHDTTLGPALGGTRLWSYENEQEALIDALRLAGGMSRKASISGLDAGGGKGVIIARPEQKTENLLRAYGRFVETFKGRFVTGEDVGIGIDDAKIMHQETQYIVGITEEVGDPSPFTAHGVVCGMRACAKAVYGTPSLSGIKVAIQGVGHVGYNLAKLLYKEGAELVVSDIKEVLTKRVADEFNAKVVSIAEIFSADCDIFAPCALGAVINDETIAHLKCKIVAGAANNQLHENRHGELLVNKGILYAPDYVINAGGLIAVYLEMRHHTAEEIMKRIEQIGNRIEDIIVLSKENREPTHEIANKLADERIFNKKQELKAPGKT